MNAYSGMHAYFDASGRAVGCGQNKEPRTHNRSKVFKAIPMEDLPPEDRRDIVAMFVASPYAGGRMLRMSPADAISESE